MLPIKATERGPRTSPTLHISPLPPFVITLARFTQAIRKIGFANSFCALCFEYGIQWRIYILFMQIFDFSQTLTEREINKRESKGHGSDIENSKRPWSSRRYADFILPLSPCAGRRAGNASAEVNRKWKADDATLTVLPYITAGQDQRRSRPVCHTKD